MFNLVVYIENPTKALVIFAVRAHTCCSTLCSMFCAGSSIHNAQKLQYPSVLISEGVNGGRVGVPSNQH